MTERTAADPLALAQCLARLRGIETDGLTLAQIETALAAHQADLDARRSWLAPGTSTVTESTEAMIAAADRVTGIGPLGFALEGVLLNATSHLPQFSNPDEPQHPWGCATCGCVDGIGACDTWQTALALTVAINAALRTEFGRQIVDGSCGNAHLIGHVSSVYAARDEALRGGNNLGLHADQRLVTRLVGAWTRDREES